MNQSLRRSNDLDLRLAKKLSLDLPYCLKGQATVGGVTDQDPCQKQLQTDEVVGKERPLHEKALDGLAEPDLDLEETRLDQTRGNYCVFCGQNPETWIDEFLAITGNFNSSSDCSFTEVSFLKTSLLVTPPPINRKLQQSPHSPEITPFIALQLRVARLEQEMSEVKKTDHSADVLASIRTQVPTAVDKYLGTKLNDALLKVLERHTADLIEKYSVLPGPLLKTPWIRSGLQGDKTKEEKHDSDDDVDEVDDKVPSAWIIPWLGQQRKEDLILPLLGQLNLLQKMMTKVLRNQGSLVHLLPNNIQLSHQPDGRSLTQERWSRLLNA
ncbi:hypothetical protein Tco_1292328 [Tanacetum coccineum]